MLCIGFLIGFLQLVGTVYGQVDKTASACFNVAGCDTLHLNCSDGRRIFIARILYGFKPSNSMCRSSPSCGECCSVQTGDSFQAYSEQDFGLVYANSSCWNRESCTSPAQQGVQNSSKSTYAVVLYNCLGAGNMIDFYREGSITAPAVAIHYNASDVSNYPLGNRDNRTWHCLVNYTDPLMRSVDVTVVRESYNARSTNTCTSVGWISHTEEFLPCSPEFRYRNNTLTTPFRISVRVHGADRLPNGWTVVRSLDGSDLVVTCGILDSIPITSISSSGSATPSTARSTTQQPFAVTSPAPTSNAYPKQMTSPSAGLDERSREENADKGAMVAGWVLAAVLAVLLAVLGVLLLHRHGGCRSCMQHLMGRPSSSHAATPRDQYVVPDPSHAPHQARRAPVYENAASRQSASDSEYVNAASERSRPASQHEYSPLEWSRDPPTTYSQLKMA